MAVDASTAAIASFRIKKPLSKLSLRTALNALTKRGIPCKHAISKTVAKMSQIERKKQMISGLNVAGNP